MKPEPGKIVIFGQYKSGTTALFTKLKNSLPGDTRTMFEPRAYLPEQGDEQRWLLSKTILKFPGHPEPVDYESFLGFDRKLYLPRDPRDWLLSYTLFMTQEKESIYKSDQSIAFVLDYLRRKEADPTNVPLTQLLEYLLTAPPVLSLEYFAERTRDLQLWCIEFHSALKESFTITYEDFVDRRLTALEDYLGFSLVGTSQVDKQFDHVPRTCAYGDWKNWLLPEDIAYFRPFFAPYIAHHGYPVEWEPNQAPVIRPEYSSDYVARVIRRKRALAGLS